MLCLDLLGQLPETSALDSVGQLAIALVPIKLPLLFRGVCSPSSATYCSNPFEIFIFRYESMLLATSGFIPVSSAAVCLEAAFLSDIRYSYNFTDFFLMSAISGVAFAFLWTCYYVFWTMYLGFFPPLPFVVYFAGNLCAFSWWIVLWFR